MRHKLVIAICLLVSLFCVAELRAADFSLEWRATIAPPAHEPVIGDMVARYMLEATPAVAFEYGRAEVSLRSWGVNKWRPPSVRGHGWEKYEDSDYTVEEWRSSITARGELGPDILHLYTEYYYPLDRDEWGGHGIESNYYWLVGVGGRFD